MPWSVLYIIDALAILSFAISYYLKCYRRGYRVDIWHAQLFFACVFPNMILLPAARSRMNEIVLGDDYAAVVAVLPNVFLITLLGYFTMLAGGELWRVQAGMGLRKGAKQVLDFLPSCSMMLMSSRSLLILQSLLCLLLQSLILLLYFASNGFGFDLREYTFAHPALRPIAQTAATYSVVIASHCLARYVDLKEKTMLACVLLLTFGLVFFGARSYLLAIYINVLMCYFVRRRERLNLLWFSTTVFLIVSFGFYLGSLRAGQYSPIQFFGSLLFLLLYGNNFSDLRDFAWVYSGWDHGFWAGRTYLAALASFVPRVASKFRDTWGLGVATDLTVGFDPEVHPGLRPGNFGEGYLNFGILGVICVGILLGILTRRVDIDTKNAFSGSHSSMMHAFASTSLLQVAGWVAISVNLSGFYVLLGIYAFSWVCLQILRLTRLESEAPRAFA